MWKGLVFSGSVIVTALAVMSCGLICTLVALTEVSLVLTELLEPGPGTPPSGLQDFIADVRHTFVSGEVLRHLNQSALAASAVLFSLVTLLIFVEEALLQVKERVRQWGRLPSPQVLHHYNHNSYDVALDTTGQGLVLKKAL
ncbi:hypothetical protein JKF63_01431 [Porcisia hertigi]|uniref:Uncharacterized protein n=1 Tax=Porcisia hertigi TaxID=2761500 RepID=A0A836I9B1_9TRYP|nr:hypothetical protein JKF63_01431 [Porcisia hertigi]